MSLLDQKTINKPITFEGIGLHTGKKVSMTVSPSGPNTGITFKRVDLKKNNLINRKKDSLLSILFEELHKDSPDGSL